MAAPPGSRRCTSTKIPAPTTSPSTRRARIFSTRRSTSGAAAHSDTPAAARAAGCIAPTDAGMHWTKMAGGLPAQGDLGRCALDIYRKNPNIVYALVEHATLGGVYRSEDKALPGCA